MKRPRLLAATVPTLLAAALAATPASDPAGPAARPHVPHCVATDGFDFNKVFHVKERITAPPLSFRVAIAKEPWVGPCARASRTWPDSRNPSPCHRP
ncbi:hypothetical protein ACFVHW_10515 [Streptomyces sp. NPDC127110]|uniref:hypothetical protein n=1 Tax=Streptomyces sp. NPDC127110 TaxID=3345362 RepID=UPI003637CC54